MQINAVHHQLGLGINHNDVDQETITAKDKLTYFQQIKSLWEVLN
jgi:hypothetical protein